MARAQPDTYMGHHRGAISRVGYMFAPVNMYMGPADDSTNGWLRQLIKEKHECANRGI